MKVLVTGATGFVGRHLVARLAADSSVVEIVCLVRPASNAAERAVLSHLSHLGTRCIYGDLSDEGVAPEPPPRIDVVFHLAANTDTAAPESDLRVNDLGTGHLLAWLGASAQGTRIVYSSSIAALDRDGPATGPLNEKSRCVPRTAYGRTKLRGEQILQSAAIARQYSYTILRLATIYGPGAKVNGLFDRLFTLAARHNVLARLNWPGRTSILHVNDAVAIMVDLATRPEAADQIFCAANPDAPTVGVLAEHIGRLAPEPLEPVNLPMWFWRLGRTIVWSKTFRVLTSPVVQVIFWRLTLSIDDGFWFDTTKLQTVWTQPPVDLDQGLAEMLRSETSSPPRLP